MKKSREELISAWKAEENIAHIHGWDFSHIENRYEEDTSFPWNYKSEIIKELRPEMTTEKRIIAQNIDVYL